MKVWSWAMALLAGVLHAQSYPWTPSPLSGVFSYASLPQNNLVIGTPAYTSDQGEVYWNGSTWQSIPFDPAAAMSGDCSLVSTTNVITCTKTSGVTFAPSATTDTTNAVNITSNILSAARMPAISGDCTTSNGSTAITCTKTSGVAYAASATTDTTNANNITSNTLSCARLPALTGALTTSAGSCSTSLSSPVLTGTTASLGGAALILGACTSGTVTVTGATVGMAVVATPSTYPADGVDWRAYVSSSNTDTVKICALLAVTPAASVYNVRVIPQGTI